MTHPPDSHSKTLGAAEWTAHTIARVAAAGIAPVARGGR